jgi:hypothetical protein
VGRVVGDNGCLEVREPGSSSGAYGERLSSARCGGDERGASGVEVDGRSAGGRRGGKQTEALGVLSELLAVYRETQVMEETCVARKLDDLCGVNVGKHKGSAGDCSPNLQVCGKPAVAARGVSQQ